MGIMVDNPLDTFLNRSEFWKNRVSIDLTGITDIESINQIAGVMRDPTEMDEVRESAGASLGHIGTDNALDILEQDAKFNTDEKTRLFAMIGLQVTVNPRADAIQLDLLQNDNTPPRIRKTAMYSLANRKNEAVIPLAIQYINKPFATDNGFMGSNIAVESLLKFGDSTGIDVILDWSMQAVQDTQRDPLQREHAANYLARYADVRCESFLIEMLDNPVMQAKRIYTGDSYNHAIKALQRIDTPTAHQAIQAWQYRSSNDS